VHTSSNQCLPTSPSLAHVGPAFPRTPRSRATDDRRTRAPLDGVLRLAITVLVLALVSGTALAAPMATEDGAAPASAHERSNQETPTTVQEGSVPPSQPADVSSTFDGRTPKLDFDFFGAPSNGATLPSSSQAKHDDEVAEQVVSRRHRLTVHQTLGLVTWGLMLAASVVGQLNYHDLYGGGSGRGTWLIPHKVLAYSSAIMFGTTAGYALLAPKPYPKPLKLDTGLLHRIAAIGASAGMVAQIVLGFITARTADAGNPDGLKRNAQIHQVLGWSTFGLMTVAGAAWVF
jgi:hypothetical protein